jgi:alanine dehydrogenase
LTVGLPRLHHEQGERRAFLPSLISFLDRLGVPEIVLEEGDGAGMGLGAADYLTPSKRARFADEATCLGQDLVVMLRCPTDDRLKQMRPGAVLVAMLHLDTRPKRVETLRALELQAVSLDLVRDDLGRRLVENLDAVAMNGVREAFRQLLLDAGRFAGPTRTPVRMTVLGAGAVGARAASAGVRYGDEGLRAQLKQRGLAGVEVTLIDAELAGDEGYLKQQLGQTDLLVDATKRADQSQVVVPNAWLAELPAHAVVLDHCADPYDFAFSPPHRKAIEGVPQGNLDQFVFRPGDPAFEALDARVAHAVQRTTLCCYSWPGIEPAACMEVYSKQIEPVLRAVLEVGTRQLQPTGGTWAERATARACLSQWRVSA